MSEIKLKLNSIQFKRGNIKNLPSEAKYGEPLVAYDDEGNYYLYIGLGEGKSPMLLAQSSSAEKFEFIENEIQNLSKIIENNKQELLTEIEKNKIEISFDKSTKNLSITGNNVNFDKDSNNFTLK